MGVETSTLPSLCHLLPHKGAFVVGFTPLISDLLNREGTKRLATGSAEEPDLLFHLWPQIAEVKMLLSEICICIAYVEQI